MARRGLGSSVISKGNEAPLGTRPATAVDAFHLHRGCKWERSWGKRQGCSSSPSALLWPIPGFSLSATETILCSNAASLKLWVETHWWIMTQCVEGSNSILQVAPQSITGSLWRLLPGHSGSMTIGLCGPQSTLGKLPEVTSGWLPQLPVCFPKAFWHPWRSIEWVTGLAQPRSNVWQLPVILCSATLSIGS